MSQPSRVASARRNVRIARYTIGVTAAAALAAFAAAARVSHPGHATRARTSNASTTASALDRSAATFFGDDSGASAIGPSGSASPQIQSGGS